VAARALIAAMLLAIASAVRADEPPGTPIDAPEERAIADGRAEGAAARRASPWRLRSRHDVIVGWQPRYQLDTTATPVGLEQQLWRRVDLLLLYDRISLDGTFTIDEHTSVALHFSGWGSVDLLSDASGGVASGDAAIAYAELSVAPFSLWAGRRFLAYGPPGGLHVDGGGASVRSTIGIFAEAFAGRPVTPIRTNLQGPQPDFVDDAFAYGARVGYDAAGSIAASASYAELWSHGILGSRTVDLSSVWTPGDLHVEGNLKLDAHAGGIVQARAVAAWNPIRALAIDLDYLHVEPQRWIPTWSILSVFETSTFDEAMLGATMRPWRALALRAEGAARIYTRPTNGETTTGYRADLSVHLMPGLDGGPSVRVQASRRDDGVIGYTVLTAGTAFDVLRGVIVALDGAFALDDHGGRLSTIARGNVDFALLREWAFGATLSLARTPLADAEGRAMLRIRWTPEASR
jgi:hypothetical protein